MDPWDALRADVENYGKLTGNEATAQEALDELDDRLDALEKAPKPETSPRALIFDSGESELYTSGGRGAPQAILEAAGAQNVFADEDTTWFQASWESVSKTDPEVIVVMDYNSDDPDEVDSKLKAIRSQPALKNSPAVRHDRIVVLPLALFTSGFPNIEAAEQVRAALEDFELAADSGITGTLDLP